MLQAALLRTAFSSVPLCSPWATALYDCSPVKPQSGEPSVDSTLRSVTSVRRLDDREDAVLERVVDDETVFEPDTGSERSVLRRNFGPVQEAHVLRHELRALLSAGNPNLVVREEMLTSSLVEGVLQDDDRCTLISTDLSAQVEIANGLVGPSAERADCRVDGGVTAIDDRRATLVEQTVKGLVEVRLRETGVAKRVARDAGVCRQLPSRQRRYHQGWSRCDSG